MKDVLIIIGCLVFMALALFLATAAGKWRAQRLKRAGTELGLRALAAGERAVLPSTELMRKKRRRLGAVLEGQWNGVPVMVFDLYYPMGKSSSRQTVLAVRCEGEYLPEFALVERNWLLYTPSVDLVRAGPPEALTRCWYAYTRDGSWPFGEGLTRWLAPRGSRWSYEGRGSRLVVYRRGRGAPADKLKAWLDEAFAEAQGLRAQVNGVRGDSDASELGALASALEARNVHINVSVNVRTRP